MTGKSDISPICMKYYKKLTAGLLIVGGSFLMLEHLFRFGGFDIELLGHEYYGLILIGSGFLLALKWKQLDGLKRTIKERNIHAILDEGERK